MLDFDNVRFTPALNDFSAYMSGFNVGGLDGFKDDPDGDGLPILPRIRFCELGGSEKRSLTLGEGFQNPSGMSEISAAVKRRRSGTPGTLCQQLSVPEGRQRLYL